MSGISHLFNTRFCGRIRVSSLFFFSNVKDKVSESGLVSLVISEGKIIRYN